MRHLVYLLLVANLVYFGWNIFETRAGSGQEAHVPSIPESVARLVTLQEMAAEAESVDEISSIDDLTMEQPPSAGPVILCQALGPFLAIEEMQAAESSLTEQGLQPTPRELESKELIGYWVYLPAMSWDDVQATLETLKENKDKEYYVGKTNFISLGTFRGMSRAERRLKQARQMGFEPVLQKRFAPKSNWWLDIESDGTASGLLDSIVTSQPELQLVELACY